MRKREEARKKARALVARMTLEEKASQLRYDAPPIERLGIPAYNWWNEGLHGVARAGVATSFPQAIALAAMFDKELHKEIARATAIEGRAKYNEAVKHGDHDIYKGLTFFSPNINIFRDPRWGRGHETLGEDPYLSAELGKAFVQGLQGDGEVLLASACAKHFAAHSGPEAIRHHFNVVCSEKDLWETYLPAFEALVKEADVESVMGAYNRLNGEPCCGSKTLLVDILRKSWGFKGFVVSDCWAIADFHTGHMVTNSPEESAALALENGCDLNCGSIFAQMLTSSKLRYFSEEQINAAAERLFTTRYLLGIMGEGSVYDEIPYEKVECREHLELARRAALEGCVLLKNDGLLPLDPAKTTTLGVIGPNADSRLALIGNYHGTSSRYVTVLEGIQNACGDGVRVMYAPGCEMLKSKSEALARDGDRLAEALTVAEHSDTVILVVGLDELLEGEAPDDGNSMEAGDKDDLLLPAVQRELIDKVLSVGKPTVIVLMSGSSIDLREANAKASAILLSWYPGARAGDAVAEILFGQCSPSGKLPLTFYHNEDLSHLPDFTDYSMKGRTYRYLQRPALYPFGYGLTYGDVRVVDVSLDNSPGNIKVHVKAHNVGAVATRDIVQLYIRAEDSAFAPLNPCLCGFQGIYLTPGESRSLSFELTEAAFSVVDNDGRRFIDGTHFSLYAGTSQPDARSRELLGFSPFKIDIELP